MQRILRDALRLDASGFKPLFGLRCAVGVAVPLVVALHFGRPLWGVSAAIGAMVAGFASRQGVYRTRAAAMLLVSLGMAFSAFAGSTTGGIPLAQVGVAGIWGLGFGILAALGPTANAVGLNSCLALAIFGQFRYGPGDAALQAGLVFSGGALQTLLLVLVWPLQRFTAERTVLAAAYRILADYAQHLPSVALAPPGQAEFTTLSATLADPQPFARRGEIAAFEVLLVEAERIRAALGALAIDRHALTSSGREAAGDTIVALARAAHEALTEIAGALEAGRPPADVTEAWHALAAATSRLETEDEPQALGDARALEGQLRSAWRAAQFPAEGVAETPAWGGPVLVSSSAFGEALQTLRANCSPRSAYAQHGLRLGATLMAAALLALLFPLQRGYWVSMTAVLVLRPDFATTLRLGVARIGGTLIGAVVASGIVALFHPGAETALLLALFFAALGYAVFDMSYAAFTVSVTAYVVFLLAFGGLPEHAALVERVEATILGGVLALAAYSLWPTWERELVPVRLAEMLERQRAYAMLLLAAYTHPQEYDRRELHDAQLATWLARTNAEASVDRMLDEPVRPKAITVRAALGLLAATRRIGLACLTLTARLPRAAAVPEPALAQLRDALDGGFEILATALRTRVEPPELPPLRALQIALTKAAEPAEGAPLRALVTGTDVMVDGLNTIAHLLHRLGAARQAEAFAAP